MQIIRKNNKIIEKLLNISYNSEKKYAFSKYLIKHHIDKGLILFSTISGAIVFLNEDEIHFLETDSDKCDSIIKELVFYNILVDSDKDEYYLYNQLYDTYRILLEMTKQRSLSKNFYKILTTNCCNARCEYCYKLNVKQETMSDKTIDKLIEYIINHYDNKELHLYWFGGEPLLNVRAIDKTCNSLRQLSINFKSSIITNGYLFNKDMIYRAKTDWNLKFAQITLDGTESVHNRIKDFVNPKDSPFQIIIENIENIAKHGIQVFIRLNVSYENYGDIEKLIEYLIARFGKNEFVSIYIAMVSTFVENENAVISNENLLYDVVKKMQERLHGVGILANYPIPDGMIVNSCMADDNQSVVVLPNGDFAKCDLDYDNSRFGSLFTDVIDIEMIKKWKNVRKRQEKCKDCPILPICLQLEGCKENQEKCTDLYYNNKKMLLGYGLERLYNMSKSE